MLRKRVKHPGLHQAVRQLQLQLIIIHPRGCINRPQIALGNVQDIRVALPFLQVGSMFLCIAMQV